MKTIGLIFPVLLSVINKCNLWIITMFLLFSCNSVKSQQENNKLVQYDTITQREVYVFVEKMPNYKGGNNTFIVDFRKHFHYDFQENEKIQTKLQFQFVIDEKGHLIGARIYNKKVDDLTGFEKAGLKVLELMQNWEAGKHNNNNVNVILTKTIHIDYR